MTGLKITWNCAKIGGLIALALLSGCHSAARGDAPENTLTLEIDALVVSVDLTRGGAISGIILKDRWKGRNIVNIHDEGRYIQQSYYAGRLVDRRDEGQSPNWSPWSWNPIQVDDAYGNRAQILEHRQENDRIYVKCIPMLWDMRNSPAEAVMEQWLAIEGPVIKVSSRLTCSRTDDIYGEGIINDQELPAVYPVSALSRLFTYRGEAPFTKDDLAEIEVVKLASGFWGRYTDEITENWMAFVDADGYGLTVYNPLTASFLAGMAGNPGYWAGDGSTSYIAPIKKVALNKDSVYEYSYYLIIGELAEMREHIYRLASGS